MPQAGFGGDAVALGYIMKAQGSACAIKNNSGVKICLVNVVLNHHSASSACGKLLLALDRAVIMYSRSNKVDGCVVTMYVFFPKKHLPFVAGNLCFKVASHQHLTSIGSRVVEYRPFLYIVRSYPFAGI